MSKQGENQSTTDPTHKYFAVIPFIASRELTPIQLALYTNYVQTCGRNSKGTTYKTYSTLADECHMSEASVKRARMELVELGFIKVKSYGKGQPADVSLVDIWEQNIAYAKLRGNETGKKDALASIKKDGSDRPNSDSKVSETQPNEKDGSVRPNYDEKDGSVRPINNKASKKDNPSKKKDLQDESCAVDSLIQDDRDHTGMTIAEARQPYRDFKQAKAEYEAGLEDSEPTLTVQDADKVLYGTPPIEAEKDTKPKAPKPRDPMFDEIALALGHTSESLKSTAVGRIVGQTRKAFLAEGFQLGDATDYINRLRTYYRKQEWTITDEIYKSDKNLALWAKAKATNSQIDDVNGVNTTQANEQAQRTRELMNNMSAQAEPPSDDVWEMG